MYVVIAYLPIYAYCEGKKPNDTCHQWEWRYTGLWFDN